MDRCDTLVIVELKLCLVDESFAIRLLQLQVVACRDVVVLIGVDAFEYMILFEAQFAQLFQDDRVDRNLRESNKDAAGDTRQALRRVPGMLTNISDSVAFLGVRIQDAFHHVTRVFRDELGNLEVARKNLFVQVARIGVLKWQVAAYEGEKDDADGPDIHVRAVVALASDHFGSCVARRTASSFQGLPCLISVTQAEINNLDILVVVE